ncbi:hypothetical protein CL634_10155 [bacterium]|nr:hypothetical protein [bacterium]
MIRKSDREDTLFYVVCADWESIITANDENDAATIAIEEASNEYGKNLCLAPSMTVIDMDFMYKHLDAVEATNILYTPKVLANAGMHDLSKKYAKIIKLIKTDGENNDQ